VNRNTPSIDPIERRCNFSGQLRVVIQQQRIFVVGNGNIDVGNKTPTRNPGQPIAGGLAETDDRSKLRIDEPNPLKKERPKICVAMTQQSVDSGRGNQSAPQKFVHLVGCRDPKARPEPWVRTRPDPAKR
jgi:hypothetical protein